MEKQMSFWDHLEELRSRVIHILISICVLSIFFFAFKIEKFEISSFPIYYPVPSIQDNVASIFFREISSQLLPPGVELIVTNPLDAFFAQLQISLFLATVFSIPLMIYEAIAFLSPALYEHEKKIVSRFLLPSLILFISGCAFCYFLLLPFILRFLYAYAFSLGAIGYINIHDFISITLLTMLAFGIVFELPLLMIGLSWLDVISPYFWRENWRYAVLAFFIFAAIITPDGTGITQLLVAVPMCLLYLLGYMGCRKLKR